MASNLNHSQHHWGYSAASAPQNQWIPPQTRSMKRAISESDCDDMFSEESSKEQASPSASNSCQMLNRKKRRGVIEKKRRDRINSSLSELKRLVPSAYEKQGSAKLEKAEILKLTVEHLQNLHSRRSESIAQDPQRFAMEYHIIGFRECAAEVARYLVTIEGMDIQDPLRLRLMSHLQYFLQQRELSAKACTSPTWSSAPYQPNCASPSYQIYPPQANPVSTYIPETIPAPTQTYSALNVTPINPVMHLETPMPTHDRPIVPVHPSEPSSHLNDTTKSAQHHHQHQHQHHQQQQQQQQQQQPQSPPQNQHNNQSQQQQQQQQPPSQQQQQNHNYEQNHQNHEYESTMYIELTTPHNRNTHNMSYGNPQYATSVPQSYTAPTNTNYVGSNGSAKPYRPWGAEMAY